MLFVVELDGRSFVEQAKVQDDWGWYRGMIGSMLKVGSGNFGMFMMDNAKGIMRNVPGCTEPIAWCG
jgi:hypothetical protein